MGVFYGLRIVAFYVLLGLSAFIWCSIGLLVAPFLSFPARYRFINVYWCRFGVMLSKYLLGIDYRVTGIENIPNERCVILSNHQSTWETFFLSAYFQPLSADNNLDYLSRDGFKIMSLGDILSMPNASINLNPYLWLNESNGDWSFSFFLV